MRKLLGGLFVFITYYAFFLKGKKSQLPQPASFESSTSYNWGRYGISPTQHYKTFPQSSVRPNLMLKNDRCHKGLLFVEPIQQSRSSLMVFDNNGHLVWMPPHPELHNAHQFQVCHVSGQSYITFLAGQRDVYTMLDDSYQVHKNLKPVGQFAGQLSGLRFTRAGTALIVIKNASDSHDFDLKKQNPDTILQELSVNGDLLFEWRASRHQVGDHNSRGVFPFQTADKDDEGNFIISSGDAIICISGHDGHLLWQLGGDGNDFHIVGHSTRLFSSRHSAKWYNNTTLLITNHRSTDETPLDSIIFVRVNTQSMTAVVSTALESFAEEVPCLTKFQHLKDTILAHGEDGSTATEFSGSEILCQTHFGAMRLPSSWTSGYRFSKYQWSGTPHTLPQVVVSREENAIYVSWNGATTVDTWMLQSAPVQEGNAFIDHVHIRKTGFETRIDLPKHTEEYIRVTALDGSWKTIAHSRAVSRKEGSGTEMAASQWTMYKILLRLGFMTLGIFAVYIYRLVYFADDQTLVRELAGSPKMK